MRLCNRNKQSIWYANYISETILYDADENENGVQVNYSNPVEAHWNVGMVRSDIEVEMFGVKAIDAIRVVAEKEGFPLTDTSVLWWGITPVLKTGGTTDTKYNYVVSGIRPSLNEMVFYATRVG